MSNSFKGALPKDKINSRSLTARSSRRDIQNAKQTGRTKSNNKFMVRSQDGSSSAGSMIGLGTSPVNSQVDGLQKSTLNDDVRSGYELAAKPKVPCIPMFPDCEPIKAVRSLLLDGHNGAEVVYKGKEIEDSSLSVLFVGSKSRFDLQSCKPVN